MFEDIKVEYISHMGGDITVVNAARVSFANWKEVFDEKDEKLIKYLATHRHISPFHHPQISIRVTAPIALSRQLDKHQIGLTKNEQSRRYISTPPTFYMPEQFRGKAPNKKQGSSDEDVSSNVLPTGDTIANTYSTFMTFASNMYEDLLEAGLCPEQARFILPQSMNTSWIWTGSLAAFARVYNLRKTPDAQKEAQIFAKKLAEVVSPLFPISWEVLTNDAHS